MTEFDEGIPTSVDDNKDNENPENMKVEIVEENDENPAETPNEEIEKEEHKAEKEEEEDEKEEHSYSESNEEEEKEYTEMDDKIFLAIFHPDKAAVKKDPIEREYKVPKKRDPEETKEFYERNEKSATIKKQYYTAQPPEKDFFVPDSFADTKKPDEKPKEETIVSQRSNELASSRARRVVEGIVGPMASLNEFQIDDVLKRLTLTDENADYFKDKCGSGDAYDSATLIESLMVEYNRTKPTKMSLCIKSAITNMRNTVLSPRKK